MNISSRGKTIVKMHALSLFYFFFSYEFSLKYDKENWKGKSKEKFFFRKSREQTITKTSHNKYIDCKFCLVLEFNQMFASVNGEAKILLFCQRDIDTESEKKERERVRVGEGGCGNNDSKTGALIHIASLCMRNWVQCAFTNWPKTNKRSADESTRKIVSIPYKNHLK